MTSPQVQLLFLDLALILLLARCLGRLLSMVGQPPVVGEILAGVLLGPTLLDGAVADALFPVDVRVPLTGMADIGVALFMFVVGLEIDVSSLRGRGRVTAMSAFGSTAVPFLLGTALALWLLREHDSAQPVAFVAFVGLSVSVTAFPVLARVLADRGLSATAVGGIALATAAVVDVVAWIALAGVQASAGGDGRHWRVALILPYVLLMLLVVRPLLRRALLRSGTTGRLTAASCGTVLIGALLSATATEAMGMHFIFGAFLFGLVVPRHGTAGLRTELLDHTQRITSLLLPVYFVVAGLRVDLSGLGADELLQLGAILLVAVAGKFGGTYVAARSQGLPARPAAALGVLMNTRGLTELVILGIGLQLGLLDDTLYSLMVVMAVVTTAMTGPLLSRVYARPVEVQRPAGTREPDPLRASSV
ncbi:Kef-type K+ transport system membrane component KefB [Streptomyces sp. BK208]|uniref:cation:proton antiporter domain-containing protein n=1 Tax=Streptomyces sp. BK208 TaxID=2512150 RepID=UPI00105FCCCC|nr:cation:proton antiporter [Streptomyces sp. BK208]TDT42690.1 Kef-type K+ transport system membrane component KefB [Streptomyces sp. BK208]